MRVNQQNFQIYHQHFHYTICSRNLLISVAILMCLIANGISKTNAVPTDSTDGATRAHLLKRALRDVAAIAASFVQDDAARDATSVAPPASAALTSDEAASSVQPQGQCLRNGVLVAETTVSCEKQVGCRAIQKTGHCCPDYKCDCQKDGKTYSNGDKLVDPETPCTVCYCQGGEILCSSVTCFHRDDCTPKYIAGRCCPEYDNCPVSSPEPNTTTNKTVADALTAPTTLKPEVPAAVQNPKITIKEITKPIEIRITDENKAIPIHQMLKPSTTEPTTTATEATTTATTTTVATATTAPAPAAAAVVNEVDSAKVSTTQASSSTDNNHNSNNHNNNSNKQTGGINNESLKLSASVAYSSTEPPQRTYTSSPSPQEMHEIVMVDSRNGGEKPFAAFGTQGLQRVESESANDANNKVNIKREYSDTTEVLPISVSTAGSEDYVSSELNAANAVNSQHSSAEATEPDTAGSDNIYHIILTTDGPHISSSTESYLAVKGSSLKEVNFEHELNVDSNANHATAEAQLPSSTESTSIFSTTTEHNDSVALAHQSLDVITEGIESSTALSTTPTTTAEPSPQPSTEGAQQHHHQSDDEDTGIPAESNPAYPSLPEDDFSLRDVNFPLGEGDELVDEPRSIGGGATYDVLKSTKQLDDAFMNMSGSGSGDKDAVIEPSTESSGEPFSSSPAAQKIRLMYSTEDGSEENTVSNTSDFRLDYIIKDAENETGSGDSLENDSVELFMVSGSGSGGGSSEMFAVKNSSKKREPTTQRPNKRSSDALDIDELGSADGPKARVDDPKLDVESLKLDENQVDNLAKPDAASKGNILAAKTNLAQDKTIENTETAVGVDGERVQRLFLQRVY